MTVWLGLPDRSGITPDFVKMIMRRDGDGLRFYRRTDHFFASEKMQKAWNTRCAEKPVRVWINHNGYECMHICKHAFLVHRIMWALDHGVWPTHRIDHINGDRRDNSSENLRDVSFFINQQNRKMTKLNKSGVTGVWLTHRGKWRACVKAYGVVQFAKDFNHFQDAVAARLIEQDKFNFTSRHGLPEMTPSGERAAGVTLLSPVARKLKGNYIDDSRSS